MPRYIYKAQKGIDLYVEWSTVVDNWCRIGTRSDFINEGEAAERMDRVDKTGTSCRGYNHDGDGFTEGDWDDKGFVVANMRTRPGFGWLPRERLIDYLRHLRDEDIESAEALLDEREL